MKRLHQAVRPLHMIPRHQLRSSLYALAVLGCALCLSVLSDRALAQSASGELSAAAPEGPQEGMESKPLRVHSVGHSIDHEAENVERLHALIEAYHRELQEAQRTVASEEEQAKRSEARTDAENLARIPFSADKVRLNGSEGSTALSQITLRLADNNIPESRRETAPICSIRTQLHGSLISSERRSLRPVGKNHYVARIRLQAGDTSLRIQEQRWDVRLPRNMSDSEFLITLYRAPGSESELHLFAIDDLLAEDAPHIPAWLPDDIQLTAKSG